MSAVSPCKALLFAPSFSEYEKALLDSRCSIEYCYLKEENGYVIKDFDTDLLKDKDICFLYPEFDAPETPYNHRYL